MLKTPLTKILWSLTSVTRYNVGIKLLGILLDKRYESIYERRLELVKTKERRVHELTTGSPIPYSQYSWSQSDTGLNYGYMFR